MPAFPRPGSSGIPAAPAPRLDSLAQQSRQRQAKHREAKQVQRKATRSRAKHRNMKQSKTRQCEAKQGKEKQCIAKLSIHIGGQRISLRSLSASIKSLPEMPMPSSSSSGFSAVLQNLPEMPMPSSSSSGFLVVFQNLLVTLRVVFFNMGLLTSQIATKIHYAPWVTEHHDKRLRC